MQHKFLTCTTGVTAASGASSGFLTYGNTCLLLLPSSALVTAAAAVDLKSDRPPLASNATPTVGAAPGDIAARKPPVYDDLTEGAEPEALPMRGLAICTDIHTNNVHHRQSLDASG